MKYYRDTAGNIYAVSPIQTPKKEWVALTKKETEAHLKPKEPTNEEKAEQLKRDADKIPFATKTGTSFGTKGQVAFDANYLYCCTATNVWKRVALTSF